jgi:hypothetical protein
VIKATILRLSAWFRRRRDGLSFSDAHVKHLFMEARSERNCCLLQERAFRLEWAEKIGTGFDLAKVPISNLSNLIEFRRVG